MEPSKRKKASIKKQNADEKENPSSDISIQNKALEKITKGLKAKDQYKNAPPGKTGKK